VEVVPSPGCALRVGFEGEARYNAEVVAAASEGPEEVWRGFAIDVCN
jgi:hypothetical protein